MSIAQKFVRNWVELAKELGTTTRTIQNWRRDFGPECPQAREGRLDVAAWRAFAYGRSLRPAQSWDDPTPPPVAPRIALATRDESPRWPARRSVLFDILEEVHRAYSDEQINLMRYMEIGNATVSLIVQLGEVWGAEIDAPGYVKNWHAILAAAAQEERLEQSPLSPR